MENQHQIKKCSLVKITRTLSDGYEMYVTLSTEIVFLWEVCKEIQEKLSREKKIKIDDGHDQSTEYVLREAKYLEFENNWYVRIETINELLFD